MPMPSAVEQYVPASQQSFFPNGQPVPDLMTENEAITFLRLNEDGPDDPSRSLKYYRDRGLLHGTRIGKKVRYSKKSLLNFIDEMTQRTAKK
jgi:hypothetical protein